jgi:hypothetical protein
MGDRGPLDCWWRTARSRGRLNPGGDARRCRGEGTGCGRGRSGRGSGSESRCAPGRLAHREDGGAGGAEEERDKAATLDGIGGDPEEIDKGGDDGGPGQRGLEENALTKGG